MALSPGFSQPLWPTLLDMRCLLLQRVFDQVIFTVILFADFFCGGTVLIFITATSFRLLHFSDDPASEAISRKPFVVSEPVETYLVLKKMSILCQPP